MKHILPILTVALVGAATTAFAGTTTTYTEETFLADSHYTEKYDKLLDTTSTSINKNGTYNFGSYVVTFQGYSQLKIHANEDINLYVYDYVDGVGNRINDSALKGAAPNPVTQIGYREIDSTGAGVASTEKFRGLGTPADSEVVQRNYLGPDAEPYDVVRNSYYLGEFKAGRDYELYVSYAADGSDGQWSYTDGAGGYNIQKDALMQAYLSNSFTSFAPNAAALAQEYTALVQVNNKSFGLRTGPAFGSPLPGGNAIYVIAGLFALGFIIARRRKAIAA